MYAKINRLEYIDTPLNQITEALSDDLRIPILFDLPALDGDGVSPEIEVSVQLPEMQLHSALDLLLRNSGAGLDYVIRDEVLLITTIDRAKSLLETRIYDVGELAEFHGVSADDLSQLILMGVGDRESWSNEGGPGTATSIGNNGLLIRQTQAIHREVAEFLDQFKRLSNYNR